jgi:hypothetical protein
VTTAVTPIVAGVTLTVFVAVFLIRVRGVNAVVVIVWNTIFVAVGRRVRLHIGSFNRSDITDGTEGSWLTPLVDLRWIAIGPRGIEGRTTDL